jgi:hypothetical protein
VSALDCEGTAMSCNSAICWSVRPKRSRISAYLLRTECGAGSADLAHIICPCPFLPASCSRVYGELGERHGDLLNNPYGLAGTPLSHYLIRNCLCCHWD